MAIRPFVEFLNRECDRLLVRVDLHPGKSVRCDREDAAGFYDQSKRLIKVAAGRDDWWTIYAHEYGHLVSPDLPKALGDPRTTLSTWLSGRRIRRSRLHSAVRAIQLDELRAERVAVGLMRKYKVLPDDYVQRANAYILEFEMMRRVRKNTKACAAADEAVWRRMPKRLLKPVQFGDISPETEMFFIGACF